MTTFKSLFGSPGGAESPGGGITGFNLRNLGSAVDGQSLVYDVGSNTWEPGPGAALNYVLVSENFTAASSTVYGVDTRLGEILATLPTNAPINTFCYFSDVAVNFGTHPLTIQAPAGETIYGDTTLVLRATNEIVALIKGTGGQWVTFGTQTFAGGEGPGSGGAGDTAYPTEAWGNCTGIMNWYVDTVNGNDENDGLTQITPFRTLQKALSVLEPKFMDDCWWIYIRIKGTVTGILDFSNIYPWYDNKQWMGTLSLAKWPDEVNPWVYQAADWINASDYTYKGTWFSTKDNGLNVNLEDCRIEIGALFSFINFSVKTYNVTFKTVGIYVGRMLITNSDTADLSGCTFDTTLRNLFIDVDNSNLIVGSEWQWIGVNQILMRLFTRATLNLSFNRLHNLFATQTIDIQGERTATIYTSQEDTYKLEGLNLSSYTGNIVYGGTRNHFSFSINLPSPGNGRYMIGIPNKPCYLKNVVVSASGGTATLRPYLGGNPVGTSQTLTFSGVDNVTWFENINQVIPFARANSVVLEVMASTGVTNLFVQANLVDRI